MIQEVPVVQLVPVVECISKKILIPFESYPLVEQEGAEGAEGAEVQCPLVLPGKKQVPHNWLYRKYGRRRQHREIKERRTGEKTTLASRSNASPPTFVYFFDLFNVFAFNQVYFIILSSLSQKISHQTHPRHGLHTS